MAFLVKALSRWNESSKNADISVLRNFLAIFFEFFLDIEKFYQVLPTCQISDQLDHSNRNYGGKGAESALPRISDQLDHSNRNYGGRGGGQNLRSPGHTNLQKAQPV